MGRNDVASRILHKVISFYSIGYSKLIVASIVLSKFLHYTILVTISSKSFFQQNFNLTPKGPRVFWCKTTQNYPLLKKESVILF
jgi:hypothetical protein